ncbi:MAG: STAS domain-containing protein, partial [Opitutae bacterium]
LILVSAITVITHNLALAVISGVIVSALGFAWKSAHHIHCKTETLEDGTKVYHLSGPLFFGSVTDFNLGFDPASDPDSVVVDMKDSRVWDHSGLEALHKLGERYQGVGKNLRVRHISKNCQNLLKKAGSLVHIDILPDDPSYHVAQFNMPAKNTLHTNA